MRERRVKPQVQTLRVRVDRQPSGRVRGCLVPLGVCHKRGGERAATMALRQAPIVSTAASVRRRRHLRVSTVQHRVVTFGPVRDSHQYSLSGGRAWASPDILSGSAMCAGLLRLSWLVRERSLVWPLLLRYRSCRRVATGCVPVGFSRSNSPARVVAHALTGPQAGHWLACPLYEASRKRT